MVADHDAEMAWPSADQLGEGPVWDDKRRLLYRVDLAAGAVLSLDLDAGTVDTPGIAARRWRPDVVG